MKSNSLLIITILLIFSCRKSIVKTHVLHSSNSIAHSKELGVYITEYEPLSKKVDLGNEVVTLEEIWIEYYWEYIRLVMW